MTWCAGRTPRPRPDPGPHVPTRQLWPSPSLWPAQLPNFKKRFCFTLWCSADGAGASRPIDHATLRRMEVLPSMAEAGAVAERWRRRRGKSIPYGPALPRCLRPLLLPEMRMCLVRVVHADDEVRLIACVAA